MDVEVRELKARLAEYLDRAQRGEVIRVTSRGEPKAMLIAAIAPEAERPIDRGISEGWVTPARRHDRPGPPPRLRIDRMIRELIDEDRGG